MTKARLCAFLALVLLATLSTPVLAQDEMEAEGEAFPEEGEQPPNKQEVVSASAKTQLSWPRYEDFSCPPPVDKYPNHYVICVDTFGTRIRHTKMTPRIDGVIKPNHPILVMVHHDVRYKVKIGALGTIGSYVPGVEGAPSSGGSLGLAGDEEPEIEMTVTEKEIPPQVPGKGGVGVKLLRQRNDGTWEEMDSLEIDFLVDATYSGALRLGVGAAFGGAVDGHYAVRTYPGARQAEIAAEEPQLANLELVVGYASFLDRGGRSELGCDSFLCLAPYFGIGVLSHDSATEDLRFFSSLHVGLEIELVKNFSVAVTAVGRRVSRLATGLEVGGPASPNADITTTRFEVGPAVVLNLSPTFFKFAVGTTKTAGDAF